MPALSPLSPTEERKASPALTKGSHARPALRRLAVMGGAYGNLPALAACFRHAREHGCEEIAFLGDATGCCGHSDEVVQMVRDRCSILVAGNHEQNAAAGSLDCGCNYSSAEDEHYGGLAHRYAMQSLSGENRAWLGTWPDLATLETAGGRLLLCHGSPAQTNEFLYASELRESRLEGWLTEHEAVALACTHTGLPWACAVGEGKVAVNCGAAGKPDHDHDAAVHYAILDYSSARWSAEIQRVEYEHLAWADQLDGEGVDDLFTIPLRNGVWTCGLLSMPAAERVLRPRSLARVEAAAHR